MTKAKATKKSGLRRRQVIAAHGREAAKAVGALLGFYRRIDGGSQKEVSDAASLHPSELAMYESGQRLASLEALEKISGVLGLDAYQRRQLQIISAYPNQPRFPDHEWLVPNDVLNGIPIFLRKLDKESEFLTTTDISEVWTVTNRPLAVDGKMFEMLKSRLLNQKRKFVYFVGGSGGEESFQALCSRLCADSPTLTSTIPDRLQCVLAPATLCLYHFGLCNPGQQGRMFGRAVIYQNGLPVGVQSMDSLQVLRAYELLAPVYDLCKTKKWEKINTDYGTFQLLKPLV